MRVRNLLYNLGLLICNPCETKAALTCFEQDDLVILAEVHESRDALGELHDVLDGVCNLQGALLPHPFCRLNAQRLLIHSLTKRQISKQVTRLTIYCNMIMLYLELKAAGFFRCVDVPGAFLQLLWAVLTRLQVRLHDIVSDSLWTEIQHINTFSLRICLFRHK